MAYHEMRVRVNGSTVGHWLYVARHSGYPLLGLLHDAVEDGYLPAALTRVWPGLDAITRRSGEQYADYIERVAQHPAARRVKLTDLGHNMTRNGGAPASLMRRYRKARARLSAYERQETERRP